MKGGRSVAASGYRGLCSSKDVEGRAPDACDKEPRLNCSRDELAKLGGGSSVPEDGRGSSSEPLADTVSNELRADTAQHSTVECWVCVSSKSQSES